MCLPVYFLYKREREFLVPVKKRTPPKRFKTEYDKTLYTIFDTHFSMQTRQSNLTMTWTETKWTTYD